MLIHVNQHLRSIWILVRRLVDPQTNNNYEEELKNMTNQYFEFCNILINCTILLGWTREYYPTCMHICCIRRWIKHFGKFTTISWSRWLLLNGTQGKCRTKTRYDEIDCNRPGNLFRTAQTHHWTGGASGEESCAFSFGALGKINNYKLDHNQASYAMLVQSGIANNNLRNKSATGLYGTIGDLQVPKVMVMKKRICCGPVF
jgi:hypothetical protein